MAVSTTYNADGFLDAGFEHIKGLADDILLALLSAGARSGKDVATEAYRMAYQMEKTGQHALEEWRIQKLKNSPEFRLTGVIHIGGHPVDDDATLADVEEGFADGTLGVYRNLKDETFWGIIEIPYGYSLLGPCLSEDSIKEHFDDFVRDLTGMPHRLLEETED